MHSKRVQRSAMQWDGIGINEDDDEIPYIKGFIENVGKLTPLHALIGTSSSTSSDGQPIAAAVTPAPAYGSPPNKFDKS